LLLLLLTAPDGRFISPRWRLCVPVILAFIFFWSAWAALNAFTNDDLSAYLGHHGTLESGGVAETPLMQLMGMGTLLTLVGLAGLSALALVLRYRRSRGEERQQVKWVAFGCGLALLFQAGDVSHIEAEPWSSIQAGFGMATYLSVTLGFGFALLKYRLWDIDVVLKRSLIYGTLWLAIAAAYTGAALVLGLAVSERVPAWLAISLTVLATLAFQPARRHLERLADRWIFGRREPAIKAVQSFGQRLGNAQHIDDIAGQLTRAARTAVPIEWVQVRIENSTTIEIGPAGRQPTASVALVHGEERLGRLAYRPLPGYELSEEERATLAALCTQASTAISHAFLAARIVRAQELERRRIERNIHDGAQQELVALVAKVGLARNQNGALDHGEFLADLQGEIRAILANLRELAQGVHPSVLADGGLAAAIEDRCSRLSIPVNLRLAPAVRARRLPSDIEAAAYFVVAEGLTNLLRHSGASTATVEASLSGANLVLLVSDDGAGFDPAAVSRLGGLQGLADRLQAIGGSLAVESVPGQGTSLRARLPVPVATAPT
jgi:signal transduction histidine kinase